MATDTATANRERSMRILAAMPPYPKAEIPAPYTAAVPLRVEPETGRVRVGDTRVSIDNVLYEHKRGVSPRTIVRSFTTLTLPDVFAVIAYYYQHQEEVWTPTSRRGGSTRTRCGRLQRQRTTVSWSAYTPAPRRWGYGSCRPHRIQRCLMKCM